jgi:cell division protein FtsI/penicillin-binding protein 2
MAACCEREEFSRVHTNEKSIAFAPADKPKIAFGIIAESAGPAEYAGAKIVHDFLVTMKPRL